MCAHCTADMRLLVLLLLLLLLVWRHLLFL